MMTLNENQIVTRTGPESVRSLRACRHVNEMQIAKQITDEKCLACNGAGTIWDWSWLFPRLVDCKLCEGTGQRIVIWLIWPTGAQRPLQGPPSVPVGAEHDQIAESLVALRRHVASRLREARLEERGARMMGLEFMAVLNQTVIAELSLLRKFVAKNPREATAATTRAQSVGLSSVEPPTGTSGLTDCGKELLP